MKSTFLLLITLTLFSGVKANPTRSIIHLKDLGWQVEGKNLKEVEVVKTGDFIVADIEQDETDIRMAAIYLYGGAHLFSVYINNDEIKNELNGEDFHADITPFLESGYGVLKLKAKENISLQDFRSVIENAQISVLNNVFICHVEMMEDPFFGGKMVEATIKNILDKDVDGKLIANVLDLKSLKLVAENNNCAFSRQNSEIAIDINFPDADALKKGQQYLLNISIVDKENNEEVVDELVVPVRF